MFEELIVNPGLLVGAGLFVTALVGLLKATGFLQDGESGRWAAGLNLVLYVAAVGYAYFGGDVAQIDGALALASVFLVNITGLLAQMGVSELFYRISANIGLPWAGYSFN